MTEKIKNVMSIIVGGLITFILWRIFISFIEQASILAAFLCSIVGGYIAGRPRINGIPYVRTGAVIQFAIGYNIYKVYTNFISPPF